jgi:hypothetical protein
MVDDAIYYSKQAPAVGVYKIKYEMTEHRPSSA